MCQASLGGLFSHNIGSLCVSVSHFGNLANVSNFFINIIFL